MIETINTIGGYGFSKEAFFERLKESKIDILVDIRQRRGMRGKLYAFLNAKALASELERHGIAYIHIKELAPTDEVRDAQREDDLKSGVKKRTRAELSDAFRDAYREKILVGSSAEKILAKIQNYRHPCFFCVEGPVAACHRSLVTDWLIGYRNFHVNNIANS
jgi:uncharacterized protein (DUF488 family)